MLGATVLLSGLQADGFRLRAGDGTSIVIEPASRLTDWHRQAIRAERRGLLLLLAMQQVDVELTALRARSRRTA